MISVVVSYSGVPEYVGRCVNVYVIEPEGVVQYVMGTLFVTGAEDV